MGPVEDYNLSDNKLIYLSNEIRITEQPTRSTISMHQRDNPKIILGATETFQLLLSELNKQVSTCNPDDELKKWYGGNI